LFVGRQSIRNANGLSTEDYRTALRNKTKDPVS
jgi:hypothetical protein